MVEDILWKRLREILLDVVRENLRLWWNIVNEERIQCHQIHIKIRRFSKNGGTPVPDVDKTNGDIRHRKLKLRILHEFVVNNIYISLHIRRTIMVDTNIDY